MGIVYRARDESLGRAVALKVPSTRRMQTAAADSFAKHGRRRPSFIVPRRSERETKSMRGHRCGCSRARRDSGLSRASGAVDPREQILDRGLLSELNALALNWFTAAEVGSVAPAFAGRPRADRFGVFCSWVTRAAAHEGTARFDVTQKKYKDWPPMW